MECESKAIIVDSCAILFVLYAGRSDIRGRNHRRIKGSARVWIRVHQEGLHSAGEESKGAELGEQQVQDKRAPSDTKD